MISSGDARETAQDILSLEEARRNKVRLSWPKGGGESSPALSWVFELPFSTEDGGNSPNIITLNNYPMTRIIPHIDWTSFVQTWDLAAHTYPSAYDKKSRKKTEKDLQKLREDAKAMLNRIVSDSIFSPRGVVGIFPACSETDDIVLYSPGKCRGDCRGENREEAARFIFPRNQERKKDGEPNPCLADFILPREIFEREQTANPAAHLGLYALSVGFGLREAEEEYRNGKDDYGALLLAGLANSLTEAFSEEIHQRLSNALSAAGEKTPGEKAPPGIRPAFGNPACPDHRDKEIAFALLGAEKRCGLKLTDTAMIIPAASVCGIYITHPGSFYFSIGSMGDDQFHDWAGRKGISPAEARTRLGGL